MIRCGGVRAQGRPIAGEASEYRTHGCGSGREAGVDHGRPRLGGLEQRAHRAPAVLDEAAVRGAGEGVGDVGAGTEMIA